MVMHIFSGGTACQICQIGMNCSINADCLNYCTAGKCIASTTTTTTTTTFTTTTTSTTTTTRIPPSNWNTAQTATALSKNGLSTGTLTASMSLPISYISGNIITFTTLIVNQSDFIRITAQTVS